MTLLDAPVPLSPAVQRARLANLLQSNRRARRISVGALARRSSHFSAADLRAYERGARDADAATASALAELYGVDLDLIAPPRTLVEVDLEQGAIAAAGVVRTIDRDDALGAYLELVYELRGERGTIPLRDDDVHVLATTLDLDRDDVADRLVELMKVSRSDANKLLTSLLVGLPTGAAVAGLIVVGSLALRSGDDAAPSGSPSNGNATEAVSTTVAEPPVTSAPETSVDTPTDAIPEEPEPPATSAPAARSPRSSTPAPVVETPEESAPQVEAPPSPAPALPRTPILIGEPPVDVTPDDGSAPPRVELPPPPAPEPEIVAPN